MARTVVRPDPKGRAALRRYIVRIHNSVVDDIEDDAQYHAPVDTGALFRSIHQNKVRPLLSHVVVGTDHWQPMEYGAGPHEIWPRPPHDALFWPGAPHPVQMVHHPGNAAQPFMRPALYTYRSLVGRPKR